jgi:hypothetical protein
LLAIWATGAKADIVPTTPFLVDLGATGFGDAHRLLTLQNDGLEVGNTAAGAGGTTNFFTGNATPGSGTSCSTMNTCNGQPVINTDKSLVYSVGALGWTTGNNVGLGLDTNEAGNVAGFTINAINLTIFNSAGTALHTFSLLPADTPFDISAALLKQQQGNGNSVFNFHLDAPEAALFTSLVTANGGPSMVFEGLGSSMGNTCPSPGTAGCFATTDGADSWLAFNQLTVPAPIVGAGLPGIMAALGLLGLGRWRRKRNGIIA